MRLRVRMGRDRCSGVAMALVGLTAGCGSPQQTHAAPVEHERPVDSIRRVGPVWRSIEQAKGLRSAPSPVAVFEVRIESTVSIRPAAGSTTEKLKVTERLELRDGERFFCHSEAQVPTELVFGVHLGDPAVEMRRPAVQLRRVCTPPTYPDPELKLPAATASFRLSGDRLTAFEPPVDRRVYEPVH